MRDSDKILLAEISKWGIMSGNKPSMMANILNVSARTFSRMKKDPGRISLCELRVMLKLAKTSDADILKIMKG